MYSTDRITVPQLLAVALCLIWPLVVATALAADARIPTLSEMRLLPPYCPDTQIISKVYGRQQSPSNYDAHTRPYVDLYGSGFWDLHHYCFGLVDVVRSYRIFDRREKEGLLERSIGEFDYVLRSTNSGFILRPELHVKRAQSLVMLGRGSEAIADFKKAMALKPDYSPAYAYLSDYYKNAKNKKLALATLEEGLTQTPSDPSLLRRYASLGGKKTFTARPAAEPTSESLTQQEQAGKQIEPVPESDKSPPSGEQAPPAPPLGSSTNPYCRFCPCPLCSWVEKTAHLMWQLKATHVWDLPSNSCLPGGVWPSCGH